MVDDIKYIFRSYDVRGVYGKDIDEEIMSSIGKAFGTYIKKDVAVGCDVRLSSESLKKAFIDGCISAGINVIDIGVMPLGSAVFYGWQNSCEVAYITASHLSKEWNGVKFFNSSGIGFMEEENFKIRDIFMKGVFDEGKGKLKKEDSKKIISGYVSFLHGKVKPKRKITVALDCGNGCASLLVPKLFADGFSIIPIFDNPDGSFPGRGPDPQENEVNELKKEKADIGIAYDGDGDRMVVVDDLGRKLSPEQISFFILSDLLKAEKKPVVANVECTQLLDDIAQRFGVPLIRVNVGHTFLMEGVTKNNACYGVEVAGHYALPSIVPFDDAIAISYFVSCLLSKKEKKLSEIINEIPHYPFSRINFFCEDDKKFAVVEKLKKTFSEKYDNVSAIDGVRVDFEDGWILVRASNTELKLRLTIEAKTEKRFEELKKEFVGIIEKEISS